MSRPKLVLEVGNVSTSIVSGKLHKDEYKAFKRALGYKIENLKWVIRSKVNAAPPRLKEKVQKQMQSWDGYYSTVCYSKGHCKCDNKKINTHFPSGLLGEARKVLDKYNIPYQLVDVRNQVKPSSILSMSDGFEERDYQTRVINNSCNKKRGLIKASTGSGKTAMAASTIAKLGLFPTVFYVTSKDLLAQAKSEFEKFIVHNGSPLEVGQVGGGKKDIKDVTVMTVQTAVKCLGGVYKKFDEEDKEKDNTDISDVKGKVADLIRSAKLMMCDECVTGDSILVTRNGSIRIDELHKKIGEEVLSYDGKDVVWKKITHFYRKGKQKIVKVTLSNGRSIRCTLDHLIKTNRGWLPVAAMQEGDQVLCTVNVVAKNAFPLSGEALADTQNIFLGTKSKKEQKLNGKKSFQTACDINYVTVDSIKRCGEEEVYDITVDDTHCFFANGLLVHNCQHWASETAQIISDNSFSAYYRFGYSATPWRDKGDDILINACFGKTIADIDASFLIRRGYLIRPEILFVHVNNIKSTYSSYQRIYKHALKENAIRNKWISKLAEKFEEEDRLPLVLVSHIGHGNLLQSIIPNSTFLHGSKSSKVRREHLQKMRDKKCGTTIASTIFDEGVDVKPLDSLILAGGGKSPTRALQRIGRVLRPYTFSNGVKKDNAIVIDFYDNVKYLKDHAKARRKIYEREEEFVIKDIDMSKA